MEDDDAEKYFSASSEDVDAIEEEKEQEIVSMSEMEDVDAIQEEKEEEEREVDQPEIVSTRLDSFDLEAGRFTSNQAPRSSQVLFFVFSF